LEGKIGKARREVKRGRVGKKARDKRGILFNY
jgi:hypothetical protein